MHDTEFPDDWIDGLSPGIRDIVVAMNKAGFPTCDSGDGSSHAAGMGGARPFRHVDIPYCPIDVALVEAKRLFDWATASPLVDFPFQVDVCLTVGSDVAIVSFYDSKAAMESFGG